MGGLDATKLSVLCLDAHVLANASSTINTLPSCADTCRALLRPLTRLLTPANECTTACHIHLLFSVTSVFTLVHFGALSSLQW